LQKEKAAAPTVTQTLVEVASHHVSGKRSQRLVAATPLSLSPLQPDNLFL